MVRFLKATVPAFRELALVGLLLLAGSGLLLVSSFDTSNANATIARWLLDHPAIAWVRSIHFWSAALLLLGGVGHFVAAWRARRERPGPNARAVWIAAFFVPTIAYLLVSGWLLRGDAVAEQARATLIRLFNDLPRAEGSAGTVLWRQAQSADLAYFHHVGTATALIALLAAVAWARPRWRVRPAAAVVTAAMLLAALVEPGVGGRTVRTGLVSFGPGVLFRRGPTDPRFNVAQVRLVDGRVEGCLGCHGAVTGLGSSHDPKTIGCASCHGGNVLAADARRAHRGLVRIPGNLVDAPRTCGQAGCHDAVVPRVERSIMTTLSGVISVDRAVFGEPSAPNSPPTVNQLGHSPADTHLRQLCASCHLGQLKTEWGANSEASRGGGCNACHLKYSTAAKAELTRYAGAPSATREPPTRHPALSVNTGNDGCFGCHSRSGRVSLNYEGWCETGETSASPQAIEVTAKRRELPDGRVLRQVLPDVHQERGMECIDCHTGAELMGKGPVAARKHQQQQVRCEDCHAARLTGTDPATSDAETQLLLRLRQVKLAKRDRLAVTWTGDPLSNMLIGVDGRGRLVRKSTGEVREIIPPATACVRGNGHARLSCESCHTAWVPRCASCHTTYDAGVEAFDHVDQTWRKGAWQETAGPMEAVLPTLGVKSDPGDPLHPKGIVEIFAPGMIIELQRARKTEADATVFRRLYARVAPHTTRREARSCESCHADPVALGYGKGVLRYSPDGQSGRWSFTAEQVASVQDGLPTDAWTGFLENRGGMVSTRSDVRPFNVDEQRRILRVGACLTCHAGASTTMQQALDDFDSALRRRSSRCALPDWRK